jgi:hypothetical protein
LYVLTAHARVGESVEVRWRAGPGMHRRFVPASRRASAARLITALAGRTDVYVGVALREGRAGIRRSALIHVEMDRQDSLAALAGFAFPPTLVVGSGSAGHLHAYWSLREPVAPELAEAANRALTARLGGDPASCDAARILRPPGTLNHKHEPPRAVRLLAANGRARYSFAELTAGLDLEVRRRRSGRRRTPLPYGLGEIPARTYVRALAGCEPDRSGKARCPFHADATPSLQLYPDNHFYCFGCRAGGTIVDFAARLWQIEPRGAGFSEIVARLRARGPAARGAGRPAIFAPPDGGAAGPFPAPRTAGPRAKEHLNVPWTDIN